MSATYYYRPITEGVYLDGSRSVSLRIEIERVFDAFPVTLTREDLPKLDVLRALLGRDTDNPYAVLYDAVEKFGQVEVYATY